MVAFSSHSDVSLLQIRLAFASEFENFKFSGVRETSLCIWGDLSCPQGEV